MKKKEEKAGKHETKRERARDREREKREDKRVRGRGRTTKGRKDIPVHLYLYIPPALSKYRARSSYFLLE